MPIKGSFTQGISILFEKIVSIKEISDCLRDFKIVKTVEANEEWAFGGPTVIIPYRPEVNGYVSVDIVSHPWPDQMGDPKTDKMVFGAWSMGHFGPFAYPGNLQRASLQSWHWSDGKSAPACHSSFIRVRSSYVFGNVKGSSPLMPEDYESFDELMFVTRIGRALLSLPGAICYFNPNGESLQTADHIDDLLERYNATDLIPIELWSNVRLLKLEEHEPWYVMDSVGMLQLDVPDHEVAMENDRYDFSEISNFIRNAADYVFENGRIIEDGDTMDGPGGIRWQAATFNEPIFDPPREVIRWLPLDSSKPPSILLGGYSNEGK